MIARDEIATEPDDTATSKTKAKDAKGNRQIVNPKVGRCWGRICSRAAKKLSGYAQFVLLSLDSTRLTATSRRNQNEDVVSADAGARMRPPTILKKRARATGVTADHATLHLSSAQTDGEGELIIIIIMYIR